MRHQRPPSGSGHEASSPGRATAQMKRAFGLFAGTAGWVLSYTYPMFLIGADMETCTMNGADDGWALALVVGRPLLALSALLV